MALIASAVESHKSAGNPYLVYLRHPTTGGGPWRHGGSLGHMTFAQPGALLGFLGPRVYESLHGEAFPSGVQTAENLTLHGVVDAVVPLGGLRSVLVNSLRYARHGTSSYERAGSPSRVGSPVGGCFRCGASSGLGGQGVGRRPSFT